MSSAPPHCSPCPPPNLPASLPQPRSTHTEGHRWHTPRAMSWPRAQVAEEGQRLQHKSPWLTKQSPRGGGGEETPSDRVELPASAPNSPGRSIDGSGAAQMSPTHCSKQRCRLFTACRLSTKENMQVFPEVTCHVSVLDAFHSHPACAPLLVYH